jgi:hypothetical protein
MAIGNAHMFLFTKLCRRVLGLDATAAQTLGSLALVLRRKGVELVLTRVTNSGIRRLLRAHGVISAHDGESRNHTPKAVKCFLHHFLH